MKDEKLLSILRLQKTKNVGDILAKKLIATVGDEESIFKESITTLSKIHGIGKGSLKSLKDESVLKKAEKELSYIKKEKLSYSYGHEIISYDYSGFLFVLLGGQSG